MKEVIEGVLSDASHRDTEALAALIARSMHAGLPWQNEP